MTNLVTQYEQTNGLVRSELVRIASKFNNPDLSEMEKIEFSGTLQDIYKWEQRVKAAISMHELPNGLIGAKEDNFNGTVVNINWGGNNNWRALQYNTR
ncbi:MAG TPA: hypothetical protein VJ583_09550, partial [Nitrososphaeraceae archaeon]|nr:hypothetical protein [Nitrososphaeraceae archaeon]